MYGRYHRHFHQSPVKRMVYGVLGGPNVSDWIRFWNVSRTLKGVDSTGIRHIMDAGCGRGFYSLMLAERFPQATVTAVDDDPVLVKGLQDTALSMGLRSINVFRADLTTYVSDKKFNLICCVDVMEHIVDHDAVFNNFAQWLKPGGFLILHVPQKNQKFWFIKRIYGGDAPHCREGYDLSELTRWLESRGLQLTHHKHTFDRLAGMAVEIDEIFWQSHLYPLWLIFYPLFILIAAWDVFHRGKRGQGILIVAQKDV
jgi:trans-aconitate methyltransferase